VSNRPDDSQHVHICHHGKSFPFRLLGLRLLPKYDMVSLALALTVDGWPLDRGQLLAPLILTKGGLFFMMTNKPQRVENTSSTR